MASFTESMIKRLYIFRDKYGVSDVTILWCAIISMVTSWPFGYFFGSIMYHTRELVKSGFYWKLEYKKITVFFLKKLNI